MVMKNKIKILSFREVVDSQQYGVEGISQGIPKGPLLHIRTASPRPLATSPTRLGSSIS